MPCVGERKNPNTMGNFAKDPMYKFAAAFCDTQNTIMKEASVDYSADPARATAFPEARQALKEFYLENSVIGDAKNMSAEEYEDNVNLLFKDFEPSEPADPSQQSVRSQLRKQRYIDLISGSVLFVLFVVLIVLFRYLEVI